MRVERAQDRTFSRIGGLGVVDIVDEEGETQDIRKEDKFLQNEQFCQISWLSTTEIAQGT